MFDLLRGQFVFASEFYPSALRGLHACAGALGDKAALKFGQYAYHLPHGAAGGCFGVDVLGQGFKFDVLGAKLVQHGNQVVQTAA